MISVRAARSEATASDGRRLCVAGAEPPLVGVLVDPFDLARSGVPDDVAKGSRVGPATDGCEVRLDPYVPGPVRAPRGRTTRRSRQQLPSSADPSGETPRSSVAQPSRAWPARGRRGGQARWASCRAGRNDRSSSGRSPVCCRNLTPDREDPHMPVEAGQEAPDFTLRDQNGAERDSVVVPREEERRARLLPLGVQRAPAPVSCPPSSDRLPDFDNDDTVTLAVSCDSVFTQQRLRRARGLHLRPALRRLAPRRDRAGVRGLLERTGHALRGPSSSTSRASSAGASSTASARPGTPTSLRQGARRALRLVRVGTLLTPGA